MKGLAQIEKGIGKLKIDCFKNECRKESIIGIAAIFWNVICIGYLNHEKDISTSYFFNEVVAFYLLHCQLNRSTKEVDFITLVVFVAFFRGKIMHVETIVVLTSKRY